MKKLLQLLILCVGIGVFSNLNAQTVQAAYLVPDPQLALVDLYAVSFGIQLAKVPNVSYPDVTGTLTVPLPGATVLLAVAPHAPGDTTTIADTVKSFSVTLEAGKNYFAVGAGVLNPAAFAPNPDGRNTELTAFIIDDKRLESTVAGEVQIKFIHAVTDAPTVDVRIFGGNTIVQDIGYGDFSDYVSLTPGAYTFEIVDQSGAVLSAFAGDLSTFADSALSVGLIGFLDPAANQNGPDFEMLGGTDGGNEIPFEKVPIVGIGDDDNPIVTSYRLEQNYPNPFNPSTTIAFALPNAEQVKLAIYDITGKLVDTVVDQPFGAGLHQVKWEAGNIPSGVYFYRLETKNFTQTRKLMLLK